MSKAALIGHTGFLGGVLMKQARFDATFNSSNIEEIADQEFDLVVCAGAPAEKWKANRAPEADRANIERLIRAIERTEAGYVVVISTVDVFVPPIEVDERSPVQLLGLHPYGVHRRMLEEAVAATFPSLVVRLAGLYGEGMKKNVIFDLLNDNDVQKIDARGVFQFYGVHRLWKDIGVARDKGLSLVHLPTEPVSVAEVARDGFGFAFDNTTAGEAARYDIWTEHARVFGGSGHYIENKGQVLAGIRDFVERQRKGKGGFSA